METSVVSRERVVVESAEPQSDQEEEIVETSVIEDDDAETNSILTWVSPLHRLSRTIGCNREMDQ